MDMLSVLLSRIQMAITLGMHIIWPSLNIGLALFLCIMEGMWLKTKNPVYLQVSKFWSKIFALAFGMGVVSGIVMAYELGTNFGRFTDAIGEVLGSLFVYEVLSAFFLEAGFLGIMLFGWNRVSPKMHFLATFMVMFGTFFSAFWIMAANSWMQTPTGYTFDPVTHKFIVDNWWEVIFNPSLVDRFLHMIFATYITATFTIIGISAWYLLKQKHLEVAKTCFSFAFWCALIIVPLQILIGDRVGLIVHQYQPLKTAAIEGVWETQKGAPLVLFGIPDSKQEKNLYSIEVPYGASLINTHSLDGELVGLSSVPAEDRPLVAITFFSFRIMVGIGILLLLMSLYTLWLRKSKRLYTTRWFNRLCVLSTPLGFIATIAGWVVAETGRQPWVVYNLMRTADGASIVPAGHVAISLAAFIIVYIFIFIFFLVYFCKTICKGPPSVGKTDQEDEITPTITYMAQKEGE